MTVKNGRPGDTVNRKVREPRTARVAVTCPECDCVHCVRVSEELFPRDRYYKLADLEEMFSISRKTLKRHIYSGKLRAEKLGGRDWFVSEEALIKYREG